MYFRNIDCGCFYCFARYGFGCKLESRVVPAHQLQAEYLALVQLGRGKSAFEKAFIHGDRLFDSAFNALDGGRQCWSGAALHSYSAR